MPNSVVVTDSSTGKVNLSDEALAAYEEPGVVTQTPVVSGKRFFKAATTAERLTVLGDGPEPADGGDDDELAIVLRPTPRVRRRRRPSSAPVKEELSAAEVERMLADDADWRLAIPNGSSTDVLTKDKLREAWEADASGTVTTRLRGASNDEASLLEQAKDSLTPKAGGARFVAALGAPVTNIALVGGAAALFAALKPEDPRPALIVAAGICALAAVLMSLLGTNLLRRTTIRLSRLDLLAKRSGPPLWLSNLSVVALAAAIVLAFCAAAFPEEPESDPGVAFGKATTTQAGAATRVAFTVEWKDLGDDAAAVRTTVTPAGGSGRGTVTPVTEGGVTQQLRARVPGMSTIAVSSQALDSDRKPIGDMTTHTYEVP